MSYSCVRYEKSARRVLANSRLREEINLIWCDSCCILVEEYGINCSHDSVLAFSWSELTVTAQTRIVWDINWASQCSFLTALRAAEDILALTLPHMATVYNFSNRIGKVLGGITGDDFFTTLGHIHSSACLLASRVHVTCLSFSLLPAVVPVKGSGCYYYTKLRHFHFLWFLRCLILCFVLFQKMYFSDLFLRCSNFLFLVIMKLVLENDNKIYAHLRRLIMNFATITRKTSVRIPELMSQVCCHGLLTNPQRIEVFDWLYLLVYWSREIGSTGQIN